MIQLNLGQAHPKSHRSGGISSRYIRHRMKGCDYQTENKAYFELESGVSVVRIETLEFAAAPLCAASKLRIEANNSTIHVLFVHERALFTNITQQLALLG